MGAWPWAAVLLGWVAGAAPDPPSPDASTAPLSAAAVLAVVDARVPKLAAARLAIIEKEAELLKAQGAFDPTLTGKLTRKDQAPYDWTVTDAALLLPLPVGPEVELGHRLGVGKLPVYAGADETLQGGELRLAVTVPLLQDLGMPAARADRLVKEAAVTGARAKARQAEIAVVAKAALAWSKWVAAGEKLHLAESQAALALRRQDALDRQVTEGAAAPIDALDNARALAERRAAGADARQELEVAAHALSLWFRRDDLTRIVPGPEQLPQATAAPPAPKPDPAAALARAAAAHPDLAVLDAVIAAADIDLRRARSVLLPQLDAQGAVARDLGPSTAGPLETQAGVAVKVPVAFRKGRGGGGPSARPGDSISIREAA